jgi:hypothetical protein
MASLSVWDINVTYIISFMGIDYFSIPHEFQKVRGQRTPNRLSNKTLETSRL